MGQLCAVSFTRHGRLYYFQPGDVSPAVGDKVLVPTESGPVVAECIWAPRYSEEDAASFPTLVGMADDAALQADEAARRRRAEARVAARRLIRTHELPMRVVGVDWEAEENRITIFFSAPRRVDFRALVRDLASTLRCRIELRQLSDRDQARVQGGIGSCGRDLCCATFLKDFEPVTLRMARQQDLPPNPMRISGACGKLLCCLKYEHPLYERFQQEAPALGDRVGTPEGSGTVVGHRVPAEKVDVRLDKGGRCACSLQEVCEPRQAHEQSTASDGPVGG